MSKVIFQSSEHQNLFEKQGFIVLDFLNENERKVISLYYYEELTYKEIGHIMDLSESRISQIHSKSILTIKNYSLREGIDKGF